MSGRRSNRWCRSGDGGTEGGDGEDSGGGGGDGGDGDGRKGGGGSGGGWMWVECGGGRTLWRRSCRWTKLQVGLAFSGLFLAAVARAFRRSVLFP